MTADTLVIVFAKAPIAGRVKTRLVPPLSPTEAAAFQRAALDDVVRLARERAPGPVELRVTGPSDAVADLERRYPGTPVGPQGTGDLGERLVRAFEEAFDRGFRVALVLGSDHPTLPGGHLQEALSRVESVDLVFGPARDGGYYLVAVRAAAWPRAAAVFEGVPWSSPDLLNRSLERAERAGLRVALGSEWYDVDRAADLERLRRDAHPLSASARLLRRLGRRQVER